MIDTRAARHELGWMVGDEDVEAVHLPWDEDDDVDD
jgi:hypothetical protein